MLEHHTPFDSLQAVSGQCGPGIERGDLRVIPVTDRGLLLLQSAPARDLQEALGQELGLALPAPRSASLLGNYALLWLTPAEWLLELPAAETDVLDGSLSRRLASSLAVVTDLSDALVCIEASGPAAADILMGGCSLDLRPDAFPPGRVARTALADVPAILWNAGTPDRLRCFVDRAFAAHLLAWLEGASSS